MRPGQDRGVLRNAGPNPARRTTQEKGHAMQVLVLYAAMSWLSPRLDQSEHLARVSRMRTTPAPRWLMVRASAYCPCAICTDGDGITATGRNAYSDGVAVDPFVIPLGTRLDIPGVRIGPNRNGSWLPADDTGRLIKGRRIDIRFFGPRAHERARAYGTKRLKIRLWETP